MVKWSLTCKLSRLWRVILLIYILTFAVSLPIICSNLQNTMLDKLYTRNTSIENARLMAINSARYNRALEILKVFRQRENSTRLHKLLYGVSQSPPRVTDMSPVSHLPKQPTRTEAHRNVDLIVTIITVSRISKDKQEYQPNYLTQTLAAFIEIFNTQQDVFDTFSVALKVCNVDPQPGNYRDIELVPKWIPVYQRFSTPQTPLEFMSYNARLNKEKDDYVYCLDRSLQENTSFVLLVEDDALPRQELFSVMKTKIFRSFDKRSEMFPVISNVTFIKLYHPERLLGYISIEADRIMELISLGLILTMFVMYMYIHWAGSRNETPKILWAIIFLFFICVVLTVGRSNILEFRRVSNYLYQISSAPSCCTPAMLFPRQGAQLVSDYLKTVKCKAKFGKDSALDELKKKKNLVTKILVPNLFEHIGHFSSLRYQLLNPFIVS